MGNPSLADRGVYGAVATLLSHKSGNPRIEDRRVLSHIINCNKPRLRWRDAPNEYGSAKTLYTGESAGVTAAFSLE